MAEDLEHNKITDIPQRRELDDWLLNNGYELNSPIAHAVYELCDCLEDLLALKTVDFMSLPNVKLGAKRRLEEKINEYRFGSSEVLTDTLQQATPEIVSQHQSEQNLSAALAKDEYSIEEDLPETSMISEELIDTVDNQISNVEHILDFSEFGLNLTISVLKVGEIIPIVGDICRICNSMLYSLKDVYKDIKDSVNILRRLVDVARYLQQLPKVLKLMKENNVKTNLICENNNNNESIQEVTLEIEHLNSLLINFKEHVDTFHSIGFLKFMIRAGKFSRKLSQLDLEIQNKLYCIKELYSVVKDEYMMKMLSSLLTRKVDYQLEHQIDNIQNQIINKKLKYNYLNEDEILQQIMKNKNILKKLELYGGLSSQIIEKEINTIFTEIKTKLENIENKMDLILENTCPTLSNHHPFNETISSVVYDINDEVDDEKEERSYVYERLHMCIVIHSVPCFIVSNEEMDSVGLICEGDESTVGNGVTSPSHGTSFSEQLSMNSFKELYMTNKNLKLIIYGERGSNMLEEEDVNLSYVIPFSDYFVYIGTGVGYEFEPSSHKSQQNMFASCYQLPKIIILNMTYGAEGFAELLVQGTNASLVKAVFWMKYNSERIDSDDSQGFDNLQRHQQLSVQIITKLLSHLSNIRYEDQMRDQYFPTVLESMDVCLPEGSYGVVAGPNNDSSSLGSSPMNGFLPTNDKESLLIKQIIESPIEEEDRPVVKSTSSTSSKLLTKKGYVMMRPHSQVPYNNILHSSAKAQGWLKLNCNSELRLLSYDKPLVALLYDTIFYAEQAYLLNTVKQKHQQSVHHNKKQNKVKNSESLKTHQGSHILFVRPNIFKQSHHNTKTSRDAYNGIQDEEFVQHRHRSVVFEVIKKFIKYNYFHGIFRIPNESELRELVFSGKNIQSFLKINKTTNLSTPTNKKTTKNTSTNHHHGHHFFKNNGDNQKRNHGKVLLWIDFQNYFDCSTIIPLLLKLLFDKQCYLIMTVESFEMSQKFEKSISRNRLIRNRIEYFDLCPIDSHSLLTISSFYHDEICFDMKLRRLANLDLKKNKKVEKEDEVDAWIIEIDYAKIAQSLQKLSSNLIRIVAVYKEDGNRFIVRFSISDVRALHGMFAIFINDIGEKLIKSLIEANTRISIHKQHTLIPINGHYDDDDDDDDEMRNLNLLKSVSISINTTQFALFFERAMLKLENLTPHQYEKYKLCLKYPKVHLKAPAGAGKTYLALHTITNILRMSACSTSTSTSITNTYSNNVTHVHRNMSFLFIARNEALCLHVLKWLLSRGMRMELLKMRFFMIFEPFSDGVRTYEFVSSSSSLARIRFRKYDGRFPPQHYSNLFTIYDEAHHLYDCCDNLNDGSNKARKQESLLHALMKKYPSNGQMMLLSDISQSSTKTSSLHKSHYSHQKEEQEAAEGFIDVRSHKENGRESVQKTSGFASLNKYENMDNLFNTSDVQLYQVIRSSSRLMIGASQFALNTPSRNAFDKELGKKNRANNLDRETITHRGLVGPPLKTFLFPKPPLLFASSSSSRLFDINLLKEYGKQLCTAIDHLRRQFPNLSLDGRLAVLLPNDRFRLELYQEIHEEFSSSYHLNLVSACEAAATLQGTFMHNHAKKVSSQQQQRKEIENIIFDVIDMFDGQESLLVIAIHFDDHLSRGNEVRSQIYRAITRAQMMFVLVNVVVPGGWLEWMKRIQLSTSSCSSSSSPSPFMSSSLNFDFEDEKQRTNNSAVQKILDICDEVEESDEEVLFEGTFTHRLENQTQLSYNSETDCSEEGEEDDDNDDDEYVLEETESEEADSGDESEEVQSDTSEEIKGEGICNDGTIVDLDCLETPPRSSIEEVGVESVELDMLDVNVNRDDSLDESRVFRRRHPRLIQQSIWDTSANEIGDHEKQYEEPVFMPIFDSVSASKVQKENALLKACSDFDVETVNYLLFTEKVNVDCSDELGRTGAYRAATEGHLEVLQLLKQAGANFHLPCSLGSKNVNQKWYSIFSNKTPAINIRTPIQAAKQNSHYHCAKLIEKEMIEFENSLGADGQTLLHFAIENNEVILVQYLLSVANKASIEKRNNEMETPLLVASRVGNSSIVRMLLLKGASIYVVNNDGWSPLQTAVEHNLRNIAWLIIRNSPRATSRDTPLAKRATSLLHNLAECGDSNTLRAQPFSPRTNLDLQDQNGDTPLSLAVKNNHETAIQILLSRYANPDIKNERTFTPLHQAVRKGNLKVGKLLTNYVAAANTQDKIGVSPLHVASFMEFETLLKLLVRNKASPHLRNDVGDTPLHTAAETGNELLLGTLLRVGANPNCPNNNGNTALHLAAAKGHSKLVKLAMDFGGNPAQRNEDNQTAMGIAREHKQLSVLQLLRRHSLNSYSSAN